MDSLSLYHTSIFTLLFAYHKLNSKSVCVESKVRCKQIDCKRFLQDKPKVKRRHKIIGLRVKKKFDGVTYYGRITAIDTEITDGEEKV